MHQVVDFGLWIKNSHQARLGTAEVQDSWRAKRDPFVGDFGSGHCVV